MKTIYRKMLCMLVAVCLSGAVVVNAAVVKGTVKDTDGNPITGVVVTDGKNFSVTDGQGCFRMNTDPLRNPLVYISTPADYELPQTNGVADGFYQYQDVKKKENECNFVLKKRDKAIDSFVFIPISDPQVRNEHELNRFRNETVVDLRETVALFPEEEIIGMGLGDLVFDVMELSDPYKKAVSNLGLTMFQLMGNHDFNQKYVDMERTPLPENGYAESNYYRHFGPTDYSFNVGNVHVVAMKDIDYTGRKKYTERFTEEQLEWLKKDLSYVPKGSLVFLNVHAPVSNSTVTAGGNARNANALFNILKPYKVHIFSGHTHYYENTEPAPTIYEHNIGAACGAWWAGNVNRCGAPNGYLVVTVDGTDVKWRYKATGRPADYRFRLYKPGEFKSQADFVVVNVWDCDRTYMVNWYEDGKLKGAMQQFDDEDQDYIDMKKGKKSGYHTRHLYRAKPSGKAKRIRIEVTDRFGEVFVQEVKL